MRREYGDDVTTPRELVTLRDVQLPSGIALRVVGNRIAAFVETRPDGSKAIGTPTYVDDRMVRVDFINPSRTITYTYVNGQPTGWTGP